jgi:gamma-glutamyl hercynylcysteine S-oxide synthase
MAVGTRTGLQSERPFLLIMRHLPFLLLFFFIARMPVCLLAIPMVDHPDNDTLRIEVIKRFFPFNLPSNVATKPLFTLLLDDQPAVPFLELVPDVPNDGQFTSDSGSPRSDSVFFVLNDSIKGVMVPVGPPLGQIYPEARGRKWSIRFVNQGKTTHILENLVPFGKTTTHASISAEGTKEWPDYLCRSKLYHPNYGPVGVILPDNAWHLGWSDINIGGGKSVSGLIRRGERDKEGTSFNRWQTKIKPGGWVEYTFWIESHSGGWHEGLNLICQKRWLYDLESFNDSMYNRSDLQWMKDRYLLLLQFAWDDHYYDWISGNYTFENAFFALDSLTGGYDIFALWPTWPRLGLDQRNQWDMYRDMPGGLKALRSQADLLHRHQRKYFISYNPWDASGRAEDHLEGMAKLLEAIDADGVVLDTRGSSSYELQAAADAVKPGVIMYSEGMAVPKNMPGIVSGRVHDALYMPPPLNLNKLIRPDFAIFRVLQLGDGPIHREICCSFFNGYGMEINTMRPGRPDWIEPSYRFMGKALKILRENKSVFTSFLFTPLIHTLVDSIYVNSWKTDNKTLYTLLSMQPSGCDGPLFKMENHEPFQDSMVHLVDLWHHEEIQPVKSDSGWLIPARIEPYLASKKETREEGNIGCIAVLPLDLTVEMDAGILSVTSMKGNHIAIITGNPGYANPPDTLITGKALKYRIPFDVEKVVIQSFIDDELLDERIVRHPTEQPILITKAQCTERVKKAPRGMVEIPGGIMTFYTKRDSASPAPFIAFPDFSEPTEISMSKYYMDQNPVTNHQWQQFVDQSGYVPVDTTNYLKHWADGKIPEGLKDQPVVCICLEDIEAYARWSGKRLPTEQEWQYAAMGADKFGLNGLFGNIWQWTSDIYYNGSYYYAIIRGGSHYNPTGSIWYVRGGTVSAIHPELILLMDAGLNRNSTLGFRLVKDAVQD